MELHSSYLRMQNNTHMQTDEGAWILHRNEELVFRTADQLMDLWYKVKAKTVRSFYIPQSIVHWKPTTELGWWIKQINVLKRVVLK